MICGIGNDVIEIERVKKACASQAFLSRVYTERERARFAKSPASLAGNFAAKEAVAKALGTGFVGFGPADIEVLRDEAGGPVVYLHGGAEMRRRKIGADRLWVTISHGREVAMATAVAESISFAERADCGSAQCRVLKD